jgi:hypothetical protein
MTQTFLDRRQGAGRLKRRTPDAKIRAPSRRFTKD